MEVVAKFISYPLIIITNQWVHKGTKTFTPAQHTAASQISMCHDSFQAISESNNVAGLQLGFPFPPQTHMLHKMLHFSKWHEHIIK